MKKLLVTASILGFFSTSSHALLQGKDYSRAGDIEFTLFITFSLPTLIVGGQEVSYNSAEGKALLTQEALNVLEGKKSLILTDSPEKSAVEKAKEVLGIK